jgi:hypothetical protein
MKSRRKLRGRSRTSDEPDRCVYDWVAGDRTERTPRLARNAESKSHCIVEILEAHTNCAGVDYDMTYLVCLTEQAGGMLVR